ncbi:hypothetical protein GCM10009540_60710 [Streptomyces turgidiscabies]
MSLQVRSSSASSLGSPTSVSLGGYASNTAPSAFTNGFYDSISTAEADAHRVEYRCLLIYNDGAYQVTGITASIINQLSGGATVALATNGASAAAVASYNSGTIANDTTAPTVTTGWVSTLSIGTLNAGQVRHFWLRRTSLGDKAVSGDYVNLRIAGLEDIP